AAGKDMRRAWSALLNYALRLPRTTHSAWVRGLSSGRVSRAAVQRGDRKQDRARASAGAGQLDRLNRDLGGRVPPAQDLQLPIIPGPRGTGPHHFLFDGRDPPLRLPQPVADVPPVPQVEPLAPSPL